MNDDGPSQRSASFWERTDWASFGITTLLALTIYIFTLSPDIGLEDDGHYAAASMYLGVANNPGFSIWVVYSWLFTKLPFLNIAWRIGLSSAVAGALSCGLIALMVSRGGALLMEKFPATGRPPSRQENWLRIICGYVAGMAFGLDRCVWRYAVAVDSRPLGLLLFVLTLCFLMRWFFEPCSKRYLYVAWLGYGMTICNNQSLVTTFVGLLFLVALGEGKSGRDLLWSISLICWASFLAHAVGGWFSIWDSPFFKNVLVWLTAAITLTAGGLTFQTRGFFGEGKTVLICLILFFAGLGFYLLEPLFSMAVPPMNWGYPRTVEGFFHVVTRGQYETAHYVDNQERFLTGWRIYFEVAKNYFGLVYLAAAMIPLGFIWKIQPPVRSWLVGLMQFWFFAAVLMIVGLSPSTDMASREISAFFFAATHLVSAMLAGYGLILLAVICVKPKDEKL
ncbi:MAG: DUF2723 domain-containing protein [Verrucomicrobiota bacterium]